MKALLAVSALLLSAPAMAGSWITTGTAELPKEIQLVRDGKVTAYSTAGITSPSFDLYDDNSFGMGARTKCDPYIGDVAKETVIKIDIKERTERGEYNSDKGEYDVLSEGRQGPAKLVIQKGARVFGRCQSKTKTLEALSIQSEKEFRVEY